MGKVEKLKHQGEKEKTQPSHPQRNQSGVNTVWMEWGEKEIASDSDVLQEKSWRMTRF